jgi:TRAP-type mannitol/chloroaromatic compound transport system substrate-binding protein
VFIELGATKDQVENISSERLNLLVEFEMFEELDPELGQIIRDAIGITTDTMEDRFIVNKTIYLSSLAQMLDYYSLETTMHLDSEVLKNESMLINSAVNDFSTFPVVK